MNKLFEAIGWFTVIAIVFGMLFYWFVMVPLTYHH